jgi:predicted transcriptional regulator
LTHGTVRQQSTSATKTILGVATFPSLPAARADAGASVSLWFHLIRGVPTMTGTTTLKLSDELKARIALAAQQTGKTAHAFMVEALELQTELAERRSAFVTDALLARDEVARYGLVVDADEVFDYLKARAEGKAAPKPDPSSI